jgi:hypothetical protein
LRTADFAERRREIPLQGDHVEFVHRLRQTDDQVVQVLDDGFDIEALEPIDDALGGRGDRRHGAWSRWDIEMPRRPGDLHHRVFLRRDEVALDEGGAGDPRGGETEPEAGVDHPLEIPTSLLEAGLGLRRIHHLHQYQDLLAVLQLLLGGLEGVEVLDESDLGDGAELDPAKLER